MASVNPKPVRQRKGSAVAREVLQSLDRTERIAAFGIAVLGGLISLLSLYLILFTHQKSTISLLPFRDSHKPHHLICHLGDTAIKGGNHLITSCEHVGPTPLSQLWLNFALFAVATAIIAVFAWKRRRNLTVFAALFLGLALGPLSIGLPFVGVGAWLVWRAFRLQKYGVASFSGVSAIVREQNLARKEGRPVPEVKKFEEPPRITSSRSTSRTRGKNKSVAPEPSGPRRPTEPSKRYTPKKTRRKR